MPPIEIIRAGPEHAPALAPLFDAYRQFYRKPADLPAAEAFLRARLEAGEAVVFAAAAGSGFAGFALLYPTFTSVGLARRLTLNDLFVDPAFRRSGAGRLLVLRCMHHAAAEDAAGLQLLTEHTNAPAQALYAALGWARDEVYQRWTWSVPTAR